MIRVFPKGTKVNWITIDGILHTGIIKRNSDENAYLIIDDKTGLPVSVPTSNCTKFKKLKGGIR